MSTVETMIKRLARHDRISTLLAKASDDVLAPATPLGAGIGGTTWLLSVDDEPVFLGRHRGCQDESDESAGDEMHGGIPSC